MTSLPYDEYVKENEPEPQPGDYFGRHLYALLNWQLGRMIDARQSYGWRTVTHELSELAIKELILSNAALREHAEAADDGTEEGAPPLQTSEYPELANQLEAMLDFEHGREYRREELKHREIAEQVLAQFDIAVRDARKAYSERVATMQNVLQFPTGGKL